MKEYKLALFGDGGVGKSSLTSQFVLHYFTNEYDTNIEETHRKLVEIDQETCLLHILDTTGQEDYSTRNNDMRMYQGFLCVYSVTDRSSFDEIIKFRDQILRVKDSNRVPMVVIGNKTDLVNERQVRTEEGYNLAKSFNCPFLETSAKTRDNVENSFHTLVREISNEINIALDTPVRPKEKSEKCLIQ